MTVYTHDMINVSQGTGTGLLSMNGILWGANALQTINITRNTPAEKAQAVGHLGIVDYVSGVITSEVTLDCVLVEAAARVNPATNAAAGQPSSSIYRYAAQDVVLGTESYVLVSFGMSCSAGQPITVNFGYLTPTIASVLGTQTRPAVETGEESSFAVVMGDDGSGLILVPTWTGGSPVTSTNIPVMTSTGALNISDQGLPGGVQSMNFSGKINRDHVLDVRSAQPVDFVTTYPLDMTCEMDVFNPPSISGDTINQMWACLQGLSLQASNYGKHISPPTSNTGAAPTAGNAYLNAIGFRLTANGESVSISKYLSHTVSFIVADLDMPLPVV